MLVYYSKSFHVRDGTFKKRHISNIAVLPFKGHCLSIFNQLLLDLEFHTLNTDLCGMKMKSIIWNSCNKSETWNLIYQKNSALAMWNALQAQYEGKGYILKYNALEHYLSMKLEDYKNITAFNAAFNESISARANIDMEKTPRNDEMFYVMLVSPQYPIWAERQRYSARNFITTPTLSQLQSDVVDSWAVRRDQ